MMDRLQVEELHVAAKSAWRRLALAVGCVIAARFGGDGVFGFVAWIGWSGLSLKFAFDAALAAVAGLVKAGILVKADR